MGRAEEQARIREVLIALGGSPDAVPDADPRYPKEVSLGSRIDAYTRRRKPAAAPAPTPDAVTIVKPPTPAAAPPAETIRKPLPVPPPLRRDPAPVVLPAPPVVRRDPLPAAVPPPPVVRRAPVPPAPVVVPAPVPAAREQPVEPQPAQGRSVGSIWRLRNGLALLAAVATVVAVVVVLDRRHHAAPPATKAVVSRAGFSNPRAYARAMTSLSLANGGTKLDGQPVCASNGTWKRWSCEAKGKPSLGPYAGHWVTYRCSPSYAPQPGGRPAALLINCRPSPTSPG